MPVLGKYRSGCSQSSIRWNTGPPLLYLPGTGVASYETAITGSLQQNLSGICNSVCVWWRIMRWTLGWGSLWMVHPFLLAPNFFSVIPSMSILFCILGRNEVSTCWSSFFLIFLCFANCILGIEVSGLISTCQ